MKEEIKKIMEIPGNVKGAVILADLGYIKRKLGQEGLDKIEGTLADLGYLLEFNKVLPFHDYREAYTISLYIILRELFNWSQEDIEKMGEDSAKMSAVMKFLMKFVPFSKIVEEIPKYWSQHFDFGSLEVESNEVEKYVKMRINGYHFHPLACAHQKGYFLTIARFSINATDISVEEVKCTHNGDPYHEYLITWK